MGKHIDSKEEFMRKNFVTCEHCHYNNERSRFLRYGVCLNCGKILDEKVYFLIKINEKLRDNKRKSR